MDEKKKRRLFVGIGALCLLAVTAAMFATLGWLYSSAKEALDSKSVAVAPDSVGPIQTDGSVDVKPGEPAVSAGKIEGWRLIGNTKFPIVTIGGGSYVLFEDALGIPHAIPETVAPANHTVSSQTASAPYGGFMVLVMENGRLSYKPTRKWSGNVFFMEEDIDGDGAADLIMRRTALMSDFLVEQVYRVKAGESGEWPSFQRLIVKDIRGPFSELEYKPKTAVPAAKRGPSQATQETTGNRPAASQSPACDRNYSPRFRGQ